MFSSNGEGLILWTYLLIPPVEDNETRKRKKSCALCINLINPTQFPSKLRKQMIQILNPAKS